MRGKDLRGKRFGKLICLELAGERSPGGGMMWRCQCDCGQTTVVRQTNLESGHTKSCGCLRKRMYKDNMRLVDGTSVAMIEKRLRTPIQSNTSGYNGVYLNRRTGRWAAQITFKGRTYYLGSFADIQDAARARRKGEQMYEAFLKRYYAENAPSEPQHE